MKTESPVRALSWNLEGTRLLTAGSDVQLWHLKQQAREEPSVTFTLGGGGEENENSDEADKPQGKDIKSVMNKRKCFIILYRKPGGEY